MIWQNRRMKRSVYASQLICERPRVWYLAIGANVTIDKSVAGVRILGDRLEDEPVQAVIIDYRAATLRRHPFEYTELALAISMYVPPTVLIAYMTGGRNTRKAALMIKLLRGRNFAARGFQRWSELTAWLSCPPSLKDPNPRKAENIVLI